MDKRQWNIGTRTIYKMDGNVLFSQTIEVENADGLLTDLATQPQTTLIYHIDTEKFEHTEYTDIYICI